MQQRRVLARLVGACTAIAVTAGAAPAAASIAAAPSLTSITVSVADVSVVEGNTGTTALTFSVRLSAASGHAVTVSYATRNGTAKAPADYEARSGTLRFGAGATRKTVVVAVNGDALFEGREAMSIVLSSPTAATLADAEAKGTITDDDQKPTLAIAEASTAEGTAGQHELLFDITLSTASGVAAKVVYQTADGTATATSGDYVAVPPTPLTIAPGQTTATVAVAINGDTMSEPDESFFVMLTSPTGATLANDRASGAISNDDGPSDHLDAGDRLVAGQYLVSSNGQYRLVMQGDGNLVEYTGSDRPVWSSRTDGNPGAWAVMQADGNVVVYSAGGSPLWSTGTAGNGGAWLALQSDANVVVYSANGAPVWASSTTNDQLQPGEELHHGQFVTSANGQYRFVMQGDGNVVLYGPSGARWASSTVGSGARVAMQGDGNLVVYTAVGSPVWASNTAGNGGAHLRVQNDGNTVIYATDGRALWSTTPGSRGDDYPYKSAVCSVTGQVDGYCSSSTWYLNGNWYDSWGFAYRNCTSWVAWRMNQVNGANFTNWMGGGRWGNANHWDDNARSLGYAVDSSPARGAVAQSDAGSFGHVAWVESVNGDGTVTIEEYNRSFSGVYSRRTVPASSFVYIHVRDLVQLSKAFSTNGVHAN